MRDSLVSSGRNIRIGHSMESNASFSEKLFTKPFTLSTVEIVLASAAVFLDGTYISVVTMRISIVFQEFCCHLILFRTRWGYASNVSELSALVPFY